MQDFHLEVIGPVGDCAVLRIAGEIDVETAPELRARLVELAGKGVRHVITDLRGVGFLDSTGLGVLIGGLKRQRTQGGSLTLVTDTERILRVFRITGLVTVLPPHPSVPEAIAADPHWREAVESRAESVEEWCRRQGLAG